MTIKTLILIPARLKATRLPDKPLADLHGLPMIIHVWKRAIESQLGQVIVATDSEEILKAVECHGGQAVMTSPDHQSGSDRIYEALSQLDPEGRIEQIINLQGDLPTLDPQVIRTCLEPLKTEAVDIATLAAEIMDPHEKGNPNVVKVVGTPLQTPEILRALYFTRSTAPYGEGPLYHHIGIYAYRRKSLEQFIRLPQSLLEKREKLEQLRALEAGMRIDVALVQTVPLGVDTPQDLEKARALLAKNGL